MPDTRIMMGKGIGTNMNESDLEEYHLLGCGAV
jgi:hypothetical protein